MQKGGIGSHTKPNQGETNTWLTPREIINALGPFDLDPCAAPSPRPWSTAMIHVELPDDGLAIPWGGLRCYNLCDLDLFYQNEFGTLPAPGDPCAKCGRATSPHRHPYRVWLNPPYGKEVDVWLEKLSRHKRGIALIFARTETATWHTQVWPKAHSIFFFDGRLWFHHPDGTRGKSNAGGPSALISYSHEDTEVIRKAWENGLKGTLVEQWVGRAA